MRRVLSLLLVLLLSFTVVACGETSSSQKSPGQNASSAQTQRLANGRYTVQQATYDDGTGVYTLMLLDTPPGSPSLYRTDNLRMARLTDEELAQGEKTALKIQGNEAELYLTEDFKIEYVHNVVETQTDPNTGQSRPVIVRQESSFWTPFAGALAGQALGNLLFRPQYYVPPVYVGGPLTGYGGYGTTYGQAVNTYRTRYNATPPAVSNRQTFRTTGKLRTPPSSQSSANRKANPQGTKSSGSGFGSSQLKSSGSSSGTKMKSNQSFGSNRGSRSRSFGSSGRRRR
ncbi:hypothetical protein [Synechocystis sp. LKSZ1]|uniref:hypothetical protein n=1 Tax=Synechocystis sp. LKSZ1 TaxID=3144951 RepID=UPI00336C1711